MEWPLIHGRAIETRAFTDNLLLKIPELKFKFERMEDEKREGKFQYKAPCGKIIRSVEELEEFFVKTKTPPRDLTYINFNFTQKVKGKIIYIVNSSRKRRNSALENISSS